MWILPESLIKILAGFIEASLVPVGKAHEGVGTRRRIDFNQFLELTCRPFKLARHEEAFTESSLKVRALRIDLQTRFKQRNRVLVIILHHADPSHEKDDVGILRCQLMSAHQTIELFTRPRLRG